MDPGLVRTDLSKKGVFLDTDVAFRVEPHEVGSSQSVAVQTVEGGAIDVHDQPAKHPEFNRQYQDKIIVEMIDRGPS